MPYIAGLAPPSGIDVGKLWPPGQTYLGINFLNDWCSENDFYNFK